MTHRSPGRMRFDLDPSHNHTCDLKGEHANENL